jgi:hypothetical protein
VDCDRLGRPVSAAVQFDKDLDAVIFAVPGPQGVRTLYADDEPGHDLALALACDEWGLCAAGGYRTVDGVAQASLITYYP